jgi:hypothetical protein
MSAYCFGRDFQRTERERYPDGFDWHSLLTPIFSRPKGSGTLRGATFAQAYLNSRTCPTLGGPNEEQRGACVVSVIIEADTDTGLAKRHLRRSDATLSQADQNGRNFGMA